VPQPPIHYENVEIVRQTDLGLWVRIGGAHEVFVGRAVPLSGTTVYRAGDRGRLVVPRWFAESQGLPVRA
jgi:hypothetical protein